MNNNTLFDKIRSYSDRFLDEVISIRRHLHTFPELSFEEENTGKYISQILTKHGIEHSTGWGGHGVVATVGTGDNCLALRADIDALPILEANHDKSYCSQNEGVMHACGHDAHTASLLGTAMILKQIESELPGRIKFIFQPGEEVLPGGASILINEGVLQNPNPQAIFGQHVHPPLEAGKVGFKSGMYMASTDEIYVSVKGKGGHGAIPNDCIDPVSITSQILVSLQQLISRRSNPLIPSVLSFGKIYSVGGATNIIPNEVKLEGTFRTFDEKWRADAHNIMKTMAQSIAEGMGASCEFEILKGYPFLINNEQLTEESRKVAKAFLGEENVVELPRRMSAEDFAFYTHHIPACFYRLGTGNTKLDITSPVHTDTFDIDESALHTGMGLMAALAIEYFK